ncbi:MAG: XdhC family protein [Gammaproteobacteria bacterium]|nr:XdhC family protein [Gammaproteobacteria bacterium]
MQAVDQAVLSAVRDWLVAGESCWLATIVATYGSSPRPVGSLLACKSDGTLVGSLSGGCVEDDLIEKLIAGELVTDAPQLLKYGLAPEDTEKLGLPCGGHLHVVVEPLAPRHAPTFENIVDRLDQRACITRSVRLAAGADMTVAEVEDFAPLALHEAPGTEPVLEQTYGPRRQLFLIGAGMVSRYLAEMAQALDYDVTVCDPREDMLAQWAVPGVRTLCAMPDDAVMAHADDPRSAIIALTHDPRIDDMGLMAALDSRAWYVGAMGSSRTSAKRRERLAELDLSPEQIDRLHAPVGLPIGSKTPPEIAIAILAELTALTAQQQAMAAASGPPERATATR